MDFASLKTCMAAGIVLGLAAGPAQAQADKATTVWDAAWVGGWTSGRSSEVTIAGGMVTGFFWNGKYFTIENSTSLADGQPIKFIWPGGEARVQRAHDGDLVLIINENGRPQTGFKLKRQ